MSDRDPTKEAHDEGFTCGTIAALACVHAQDSSVLWGEIVRAAGTQQILQHALSNEGDWAWGGFARYAAVELGQAEVTKARRAVAAAKRRAAGVPLPAAPKLAVWFGPMPESNGKTNWTAILHRAEGGFSAMSEGITLARSEYHDRVRYEAARARYLIGELAEEPDILAYDDKMRSPVSGVQEDGNA